MVWNWVVQLIIAIALAVVSYLITPKPKGPAADSTKGLDNPTSDPAKPIAKIWGTLIIKDPNCLWYGEKNMRTYKKKSGGKK